MKYTALIEQGLINKNLNLRKAAELIFEKSGIKVDYSYLSKLKNGSKPPASEKLNEAIAQVLEIDPIELKAAAYREKISPEVLEKLADQEVI